MTLHCVCCQMSLLSRKTHNILPTFFTLLSAIENGLLNHSHQSSVQVPMDKILPGDLSARISEVEVQQDGCNASHRHQDIAEVLVVPWHISLNDGAETCSTHMLPVSSCVFCAILLFSRDIFCQHIHPLKNKYIILCIKKPNTISRG